MTKTRFLFPLLLPLAAVLVGCGADEPVKASQVSLPIAHSVSATPLEDPAISILQSACTDRITAKMIDPTAVDIAFQPMSGEDSVQAEVKLLTQNNGTTIIFDFTCQRTADGEIITKRISG